MDREIVYQTVDGKDFRLDAYKPKTPSGKVFIALHGGQFSEGAKGQDTGELCEYLSCRGFTCFDINYRFRQDVGGALDKTIYASEADAVAAYNWVEKHAIEYGGDPNKVAIGGISSGAVTALLTAYTKHIGVKAVVDLCGAMFGQENEIRKGGPALLIVHGEHDRSIPFAYAQTMANVAKHVGLRYRFLIYKGRVPMSFSTEINDYTLLAHIESFLRESM